MRYPFIRAEKAAYPVSVLCRVMQVSRSGFYAWLSGRRSVREGQDRRLVVVIKEAFKESRQTYGSPRIHDKLHQRGIAVGRTRVERLMRNAGITPPRKRRFRKTTDSNHKFPIADNLLDRDFSSTKPNRRWSTDITYIWTKSGWLYLAVVMDLFSRRIIGWSMKNTMATDLVLSALDMALYERRPGEGLIHHSDRGSQYASGDYQKVLDKRGIECSMSRKGDCWDNAVMESFFRTLKVERVHRDRYQDRRQAKSAVFEFIETFYNTVRCHSTLDYKSPNTFEESDPEKTQAA